MPRVVPSQVVGAIERIMPDIANQKNTQYHRAMQPSLEMILELIDQIPPELIRLDGDNYSDFIISIAGMRSIFSRWQNRDTPTPVVQSANYGQEVNPVYLLWALLGTCPDQAPHPSTLDLPFIDDGAFRESLRIDISSANQALSNGEWKAATVLAGSAIEAILLWALNQRTQDVKNAQSSPAKPLNEWILSQYISVAEELGIIGAETASSARLAKDFRNLIHPGRAERLGQKCDRGTALAALAALEFVVRDITPP